MSKWSSDSQVNKMPTVVEIVPFMEEAIVGRRGTRWSLRKQESILGGGDDVKA